MLIAWVCNNHSTYTYNTAFFILHVPRGNGNGGTGKLILATDLSPTPVPTRTLLTQGVGLILYIVGKLNYELRY